MTATENPTTDTQRPSGLDLRYINTDVRSQDDLYQHVNGTWIRDHVIPADRPIDGAFLALRDLSEERVRDIITDAAVDSQIGAFYASFMDTDAVEAAGVAALAPDLAEIDAATDATSLALAMARLERAGIGGLIGAYVNNDAKNSSEYILYLVQNGIGLPDESYYREEQYGPIREQYTEHIARMLELASLAGAGDARARAERIVALETRIAAAHWDVVARREVWRTLKQLKEQGLTIFLTTHYMEEAEALCDRVCIIRSGKKVMEGTVDEVIAASGRKDLEEAYLFCMGEEELL